MAEHEKLIGAGGPGVPIEPLRRRALQALRRARFEVRAFPIAGQPGLYTITSVVEEPAQPGLSRQDVERYVDAINNEAALARDLLLVLDELQHPHGTD